MKQLHIRWRWLPLTLAVLVAAAPVAIAQEETGNVYVVVGDNAGARLSGVTVELSGIGAPQLQVTNAQG